MSSLRTRLLGGLVFTLGILGVIGTLIGVVGIWLGSWYLLQFNATIHRHADAAVVLVGDKVERTRTFLRDARNETETLRRIVQTRARAFLENQLKDLGLDDLERRAQAGMQSADRLLELSLTAAELMEQLLVTVEGPGSEEDRSPRLDNLRQAQARLATAGERLAEVQRRLTELRERRNILAEAEQIARLALAIVFEFDAVQQRLDSFQEQLQNTRTKLDSWKDQVSAWILWAASLATLLLIWVGAGQASLAVRGWRLLRPDTSLRAETESVPD